MEKEKTVKNSFYEQYSGGIHAVFTWYSLGIQAVFTYINKL